MPSEMTAEQEVRAAWMKCGENGDGVWMYTNGYVTRRMTWPQALAFTRERQRQIAEVGEEVRMCQDFIDGRVRYLENQYESFAFGKTIEEQLAVFKRILAREQAALDELQKGMR